MRSSLRGAGAAAAATALAVVVAGSWFGYQQLAGPSCSGQIRLSVAAAPEIQPAVKAAADQWVSDGAAVGGTCIAVDVASAEPVDVAAAVATKHGASLGGVGEPSGTAVTPDVWVPDSSSWLLRLKNGGATAFAPANGASIARSPVVVAVPEPVASTRLGWPGKKLTWADLLAQVTSSKPLHAGIVEPTRDAAGLSGLLSLSAAASLTGKDDQVKAQEAMTGALRALATGRSSLRQDLLNRFPRSSSPTAIANALNAAALSEEDVMSYNQTKPPVPLAALYLDPAPVPLDYPFAVLPGVEPAKASAARVLFEVLTTPGFRNRLAAQSLRGPDGTWGDGFKAPQGAPSPAGGATTPPIGQGGTGGLDPSAIQRVTTTWTVATQPGRLLAVIDVSGSMKKPVATARNFTREQVTVAAASQGLNLFDDSWSIGLWTFSTELVGAQDWKPLVPINPLSSNRGKILQTLAGIKPKDNGDTGLYDTVLAAYKAVQQDWEPGKVNSVVLFTDGKNEDAKGISRATLLEQLRKIKDPEQPVRVIIIGIGTEVSKSELESIAGEADGAAFVAQDPSKIGEIFLQAISQRSDAPPR
ncbi:VWA domain-containing protein [Micromonospora globispora]|uniref:VWA domain-containing protein n=1 Tax=Micromonospora globispora TaxID=1450148 RepID=A0A317KD47_9ACTN|nr:VWA domain-containing protein [Micromonospora globispora]PWU49362.1 VWA domain-containing protein [Micromonospora globispora]RQX03582.1 VWA domain-containing protein [Micromonospora globispora]